VIEIYQKAAGSSEHGNPLSDDKGFGMINLVVSPAKQLDRKGAEWSSSDKSA